MYGIILGAGVVCFQVAKQLVPEGHKVALIEKDPVRAKYISTHIDCLVVNEEGLDIKSLKRAGIARTEYFLAVTSSDEMNVIACGIVASEFENPIIIARVKI